ncbi:MAG: hypothetical protein H6738_18315 [Alphaproteobacteria bacterium]|nr:hypothetical protein [Alphaproteobacteria bacterium]
MADQRSSDIFDRHELRFVDTPDGLVVALPDPETTAALQQRVLGALFGSLLLGLLLSITIILIPCALPMMLLPILLILWGMRAWWTIEVGPSGFRLDRVYTQSDQAPTVALLRGPRKTHPMSPANEPRTLPFSEVREIGHTDYGLVFHLEDGSVCEVLLERTSKEDIAAVHERLRGVWERHRAGMVGDRADAQRDLARLKALARERG